MQTFDEFDRGAMIHHDLVRAGERPTTRREAQVIGYTGGSGRHARSDLLATLALLADFVHRHQNERGECDGEQGDRGSAVKLVEPVCIEIAVKQSETNEDEEDMRAEHAQRRLAECWKRLDSDDP